MSRPLSHSSQSIKLDTQKALKAPITDKYRENYDRIFRKKDIEKNKIGKCSDKCSE